MKCALFCFDVRLGPEFEKKKDMRFLHRSGSIYKWISFMLGCLTKRICPDLSQPNNPIHIPDFVWFPFPPTQTAEISIFLGATSLPDWTLFFLFFPPLLQWPLVRFPAGTEWHRELRFWSVTEPAEVAVTRSQHQKVNLCRFIRWF